MTARVVPGYERSCCWRVHWMRTRSLEARARYSRPGSIGYASEVRQRMWARGHVVQLVRI